MLLLVVFRFRPVDPVTPFLGGAGAVGVLFGVLGWARSRPSEAELARIADQMLGARQRISTAIEFAGTDGELLALQRSDAEAWAGETDPNQLPIRWLPQRDAAAAFSSFVLVTILVFLPNPALERLHGSKDVNKVSVKADEELKQVVRSAAGGLRKDDGRRQRLRKEIAELQEFLRKADKVRPAVAALTKTQQSLSRMLDAAAQEQRTAAAAAGGEMLREPSTAEAGEALASEDPAASQAALESLAKSLPGRSQTERSAMANALGRAAEAASALPQLADALKQASEALKSEAVTEAQVALEQAARAMAELGEREAASNEVAKAINSLDDVKRQLISRGDEAKARRAEDSKGNKKETRDSERTDSSNGQNSRGESEEAAGEQESGKREGEGQGKGEGEGQGKGEGEGQGKGEGEGQGKGTGSSQGSSSSQSQGEGSKPGRGPIPTERSVGQDGRVGTGGSSLPARGSGHGLTDGPLAPDGKRRTAGSGGSGGPGILGKGPGKPTERIFVPGLLSPGQSEDVPGSKGSGAENALIPYERVYANYRQTALGQVERDLIPEQVRSLVRNYFEEITGR